jgi:hypothetical protein
MRKTGIALALLMVTSIFGAGFVKAADSYWNGKTTGNGDGVSDYWNTSNSNWNTAATGGGTQGSWTTGDNAIFGDTGGTVDLLMDLRAGVLTANEDYTLHGDDGTGANTRRYIKPTEFNVVDGKTLTMDWCAIGGVGVTNVHKTGKGTLELHTSGPTNDQTNIIVDNGTVILSTGQGKSVWWEGLLRGIWTINSNGVVKLRGADMVDGFHPININGGLMTSDSSDYVQTITFSNGGTMEQTGGGSWRMVGDIFVNASSQTATFATTNGSVYLYKNWNIQFDVQDGATVTDLLVQGHINGTGKMTKRGAGRMVLEGAPNNGGGIEVREGLLLLEYGANDKKFTMSGGALELESHPHENVFHEGFVLNSGNTKLNATDDPASTQKTGRPLHAMTADNFGSYITWVYTADFTVSPEDTGTWSFVKAFDDGGLIKIDGVQVLSNVTWNAIALNTYSLTEGKHTLELRVGNGGGGVGPRDGWEGRGLAFAKRDTGGSVSVIDYLEFTKENLDLDVLGCDFYRDAEFGGIVVNNTNTSSIKINNATTPAIRTLTLDAEGPTNGADQYALDINGSDLIVGNDKTNSIFNARLINGGKLTKMGTNTLTIAGGNQELRAYQVNAGTLTFNTLEFTTNCVLIMNGGTLSTGGYVPNSTDGLVDKRYINFGAYSASVWILTGADKSTFEDLWNNNTLTYNGVGGKTGADFDYYFTVSGETLTSIPHPYSPNFVGIRHSEDGVTVQWSGASNRTFTLEYTDNLKSPVWTGMPDYKDIAGATGVMEAVDTNNATLTRSYRISAE